MDLQDMIAWHESEGCEFAKFMAGDDPHELDRVKIHRETARVLSVLARVRAGSEVRGPYGDGVTNAKFLVIESTDPGLLRELVEALIGEKS